MEVYFIHKEILQSQLKTFRSKSFRNSILSNAFENKVTPCMDGWMDMDIYKAQFLQPRQSGHGVYRRIVALWTCAVS